MVYLGHTDGGVDKPEQISAIDRATMKDMTQTSGQPQLTATGPPYDSPRENNPVTEVRMVMMLQRGVQSSVFRGCIEASYPRLTA